MLAIEFVREPITPLPVVIELDGEPAWRAWDSAVRELDAKEKSQ